MTLRLESLFQLSGDLVSVVQGRGGFFDEETLTDDYHKRIFLNVRLHFDHIIKEVNSLHYRSSPRVLRYGLIDNKALGGFASVGNQQVDFIGINFGTIAMVSAIFTRLLCNPFFMPEIGKPESGANHGFTPFVPENADLDNFGARRPSCRVRSQFSNFMMMAALDFIISHEIAHVTKGHLGLLNNLSSGNISHEITELSCFEKQSLEVDADTEATQWTLNYASFVRRSREAFKVEGNDPLAVAWREFYADEKKTIGYCFIGSYITLRMLSPDWWDPVSQAKIAGPLPPYRMGYLAKVYADALVQLANASAEEALSFVLHRCVEAEKAFAGLLSESGIGEPDLRAIQAYFDKVKNYDDNVVNAYRGLEEKLSKFALQEESSEAQYPLRISDYRVFKGFRNGEEVFAILEAETSSPIGKNLNCICFYQSRHLPTGLPFPLFFGHDFDGDPLSETLAVEGINHVSNILNLTDVESVAFFSAADRRELLAFALQHSNCPKLKSDIRALQVSIGVNKGPA